jgi:MFS family permease
VSIPRLVTRGQGVFYGWRMVLVSGILNGFGAGVHFYGFSVFFNPMREEFGWTRAQMAGVFSLARLEGGIEGPFAGWLVDNVGPRKMFIIALVIVGAGYIAFCLINSLLMLYLIFGLLISVGYNTGFYRASNTIVANWFIKKRTRALSYLALGAGIGGAVVVPALGWLIGFAGWRWAAVIIGLLMWVVGIPLAATLRHRPEEMGLRPDGEPVEEAREKETDGQPTSASLASSAATPMARARVSEEVNFTARQALKTSTFWMLALAMVFRSTILSSIVVHQIPHLEDIGIPRHTAEAMLGLMVLMSIPGRLVFGWLGDIVSKQYLMVLVCVLQGIGVFILASASSLGWVFVFLVLYALGYGGAIPLMPAFRGELFGRKAFATIGGIMTPLTTLSAVAGPIFAGYLYDVTDSYRIAFYTFAIMVLLSGVTFFLVRPPKPPADPVSG